jgi:hypothetical protein
MKIKIIVSLLIFFHTLYASELLSIQPGQGIQKVILGMTSNELVEMIGNASAKYTFSEEEKMFLDFGYDTSKQLNFLRPFDFVLEYTGKKNKTIFSKYPVFKAYFKDDRLVYIILSSYVHDVSPNILLKTHSAFTEIKPILDTLGEHIYLPLSRYDGQYLFPKLGICLIAEDGLVKTIEIYKPLNEKEIKVFMQNISTK